MAHETEIGEADGTLEGLKHWILSLVIYWHLGRADA